MIDEEWDFVFKEAKRCAETAERISRVSSELQALGVPSPYAVDAEIGSIFWKLPDGYDFSFEVRWGATNPGDSYCGFHKQKHFRTETAFGLFTPAEIAYVICAVLKDHSTALDKAVEAAKSANIQAHSHACYQCDFSYSCTDKACRGDSSVGLKSCGQCEKAKQKGGGGSK